MAIIEFFRTKNCMHLKRNFKKSPGTLQDTPARDNIPSALIKSCLQLLDYSMPIRLRTKHLSYRCFHTSALPTASEGAMPEAVSGGALPVCVNE